MARVAWAQLRFRVTRTLALLTGLFVAATAFTVLTAASRTEQLRTVGTITASFSPSYDILVRPKGARTALEDQTGTATVLLGVLGVADAGQVTHRLVAVTVATAATGLVITAIAAVVPAALLRRLPAAHLLAEE